MKRFLERLKLIEYLTTELEIQKNEFVKNFKNHVDERNIDFFFGAFDAFSSSKNEFIGHVDYDHFKIKRRRRFFDMNINFAIAKGNYRQKGERLIIKTEINGFIGMMIPFYIILILFYSISILVIFMSDNMNSNEAIFASFIFFHAIIMFGIPYFVMRRSTQRLKHELERELYYMTKK